MRVTPKVNVFKKYSPAPVLAHVVYVKNSLKMVE
jgi:hypothetical protein